MSFGFCPDCRIPAKRKLFGASCDKCGISLKPSGATTTIKTLISLGCLLIAFLIAKNGTRQFIETTNQADLANVLFWYYMKLFLIASGVLYLAQFIIHKWYTKYVPSQEKNT